MFSVAYAQEQAPAGVVRGQTVQINPKHISIQTASGVFYLCGYDSHTYMEKDGTRVAPGALREGDPLELITDRRQDVCYMRTLRVIPIRRSASVKPLATRHRPVLDHIYPRGNMTFAGIVLRVSPEMMVLRTRQEPEKFIMLRDDTRFMSGGFPVEPGALAVNTRVFVRAGRNLDNDIEAYQVIWGEIAGPKREN
jgi:hypothetical protein